MKFGLLIRDNQFLQTDVSWRRVLTGRRESIESRRSCGRLEIVVIFNLDE